MLTFALRCASAFVGVLCCGRRHTLRTPAALSPPRLRRLPRSAAQLCIKNQSVAPEAARHGASRATGARCMMPAVAIATAPSA